MVTKPVVNGSTETWGTILNSALDDLQAGVDASLKYATATTKGDLFAATAAATVTRQPIGTNGNVLTADSTMNTGMRWGLAPGTLVFRARQTAAQTLPTATVKTVEFNVVDLDRLSGWNGSTYALTPGIPGWYECTGLVSFVANAAATGSRNVYWGPGNGTTLHGAGATFTLATNSLMTCAARAFTIYLDGGTSSTTAIQMLVQQNSGADLNTASATAAWQATMQVKYLGPAA